MKPHLWSTELVSRITGINISAHGSKSPRSSFDSTLSRWHACREDQVSKVIINHCLVRKTFLTEFL